MSHTPIPKDKDTMQAQAKQVHAGADEPLLDKLDQLNQLIDQMGICMLTTRRPHDGKLVSRPMQISGRRRGVDLVLFCHAQGHKADEIANDAHVNLSFLDRDRGDWVSVSGLATVRSLQNPTGTGAPPTDESVREYTQLVREHWTQDVAAWFPTLAESGDPAQDNHVGVAIVRATSAQYGTAKGGAVTHLFDKAYSLVTGSVLPTRNVETRCLATPDIDAARVLASASAKEAHWLLAAEQQHPGPSAIRQPVPISPLSTATGSTSDDIPTEPVSLGSGVDTFDDGRGARVEGATAIGYEGPEKHATIVASPSGVGKGEKTGYLGPQTDTKLRTSLEQAAGMHRGKGVAEE